MWDEFEFNPENVPALKLGFHIAQIVCALVLWILEIVVFRDKDTPITGGIGWTFGVCFLSIPAWIYLAGTPRFPRTRKLAQPHAMVAVDAIFAIIWLSAFSTQAAYNTAGLCKSVCGASKAIVAMGFFVLYVVTVSLFQHLLTPNLSLYSLFFCVTTFLSIYTLKYYQWNHRLPGYDKSALPDQNTIDPDKAAFSMAPHGEEAYAPVHMNDHDDHDHETPLAGPYSADTYGAPAARISPDPYGAPSSRISPDPYGGPSPGVGGGAGYGGASNAPENPFRQDNPFDDDTEYHPHVPSVAGGGRYAAPTTHDEYDADARFPSANYDRIEGR
ncbi:hypothetical protein B0H66DRAFT_164239 [Apodospora peruviana]|uniref:MARVEL domain-containing protein n=1 Tax=Apodospora peruviana TaxID=516989 RepID=A0AAE0MCD9_9PEZI|nr:hypothetical protein B0H66DRAFT_164239 [Apodospora peruviana]